MMPVWFVAALDTVLYIRSTGTPLRQALKWIFEKRHLGPAEREKVKDLLYRWSREAAAFEALFETQKVSRQERDKMVLLAIHKNETPRQPQIYPSFCEEELHKAYGATLEGAFIDLAVAMEFSLDAIEEELSRLGIKTKRLSLAPHGLRVVSGNLQLSKLPKALQKAIWPMDEGSQWVASLVGAKPGEQILDACAGGGGKTRFLLQVPDLELWCMDLSLSRLKAIQKRPGTKGARLVFGDGLNPPFLPNSFDRILLDAPCSGSGTLRRHPDALLRLSPQDVMEKSQLQQALIEALWPLLKPKGVMIYATCSVLEAENQKVIQQALKQIPGLLLVSSTKVTPQSHGCDGFFAAVLTKAN